MIPQNRETENPPVLSDLWRRLADTADSHLQTLERRRREDPDAPCDLKSLKELTALLRECTDLQRQLERQGQTPLLRVELAEEVAAWSR